jgi:hypothetical protein
MPRPSAEIVVVTHERSPTAPLDERNNLSDHLGIRITPNTDVDPTFTAIA